jgi:hypothetical protein
MLRRHFLLACMPEWRSNSVGDMARDPLVPVSVHVGQLQTMVCVWIMNRARTPLHMTFTLSTLDLVPLVAPLFAVVVPAAMLPPPLLLLSRDFMAVDAAWLRCATTVVVPWFRGMQQARRGACACCDQCAPLVRVEAPN